MHYFRMMSFNSERKSSPTSLFSFERNWLSKCKRELEWAKFKTIKTDCNEKFLTADQLNSRFPQSLSPL